MDPRVYSHSRFSKTNTPRAETVGHGAKISSIHCEFVSLAQTSAETLGLTDCATTNFLVLMSKKPCVANFPYSLDYLLNAVRSWLQKHAI